MVRVILHWELPSALQDRFAAKKMFIRWSHTCKAFGVDELILVNVDGLDAAYGDSEIKITVVDTLEEALASVPEETLVYVEQGGAPLDEFEHPQDATYVFGSDFGQLPRADVEFASNIPVNAEIACGIVLYDRSLAWHL
jgi:hypothetical protein